MRTSTNAFAIGFRALKRSLSVTLLTHVAACGRFMCAQSSFFYLIWPFQRVKHINLLHFLFLCVCVSWFLISVMLLGCNCCDLYAQFCWNLFQTIVCKKEQNWFCEKKDLSMRVCKCIIKLLSIFICGIRISSAPFPTAQQIYACS